MGGRKLSLWTDVNKHQPSLEIKLEKHWRKGKHGCWAIAAQTILLPGPVEIHKNIKVQVKTGTRSGPLGAFVFCVTVQNINKAWWLCSKWQQSRIQPTAANKKSGIRRRASARLRLWCSSLHRLCNTNTQNAAQPRKSQTLEADHGAQETASDGWPFVRRRLWGSAFPSRSFVADGFLPSWNSSNELVKSQLVPLGDFPHSFLTQSLSLSFRGVSLCLWFSFHRQKDKKQNKKQMNEILMPWAAHQLSENYYFRSSHHSLNPSCTNPKTKTRKLNLVDLKLIMSHLIKLMVNLWHVEQPYNRDL